MDTTTYPLNWLEPISLQYQGLSSTELSSCTVVTDVGLKMQQYSILQDFKDVNFNNNTGLVLTKQQSINSVFLNDATPPQIGDIPVDVFIQPERFLNSYVDYYSKDNTFRCLSTPTLFNIRRSATVSGAVNIVIQNEVQNAQFTPDNYIIIDAAYPYIARIVTSSDIQNHAECYFNFFIDTVDNGYTIRVDLPEGSRYLCLGVDNKIAATGTVLGVVKVSPYIFNFNILTRKSLDNTKTTNRWVTYYMDAINRQHNADVTVRRSLSADSNYLVSFALSDVYKESHCVVNIANLKTNFTPTGIGTNVNNILNDNISNTTQTLTLTSYNTCILTAKGVFAFTNQGTRLL